MSLNHQLRITNPSPESNINYSIFSANGEQNDIMKDGRIFAWTSSPAKKCLILCYMRKSGSIYRNVDYFNAHAPYYTGDIVINDEGEQDKYVIQGHGEMHWPNGDYYVGSFNSGFLDGHGEYTCANGNKYVGTFDCDQISGDGIFSWADGSSYEGKFFDGVPVPGPTVRGKFTFPTGEVFIGPPFGLLKKLAVIGSGKYSLLLQEAEPKKEDNYLLQPGRRLDQPSKNQ